MLKIIPEDDRLREQWNGLVLRVEQPQVFYTYEWALAVSRAYLDTVHPLLFLAYDEDSTLQGVAALVTDSSGRNVSFLCANTGDYCDFLSLAEHRIEFVGAVLGELKKLGKERVTLTNLPADSPSLHAIRQGCRHRFFCHRRTAYVCAQVELSLLQQQGGKQPVLPRKKMLRRFLNAMGRESPVRLEHARSWEEIKAILPEFMHAHMDRFLVTGRTSSLADCKRRAFLADLSQLLSQAGWVVLTRMMSGDRVFAWNYGFQFRGTWFWYQPTFDSALEKYSPGFCLLAKLIEEAWENPRFSLVDMGLGAEGYKERFANRTRRTLYVSLRTSILGHCGEVARDGVAAVVKSSPRLERAVRAVIQSLAHKEVSART